MDREVEYMDLFTPSRWIYRLMKFNWWIFFQTVRWRNQFDEYEDEGHILVNNKILIHGSHSWKKRINMAT